MFITENYSENEKINLTLDLTTEEFNEMFIRCHTCGKIMLKDDDSATLYNGYYYCSRCTVDCTCCGETVPLTHAYPVEDSSALYCTYCFENETYRCHDCGRHYRYEDSLHYCDDEYDRCDDCYDRMDNVLDDYHSFKDYGNICFLGEEKRSESPYMGYELEVDSNDYVNLSPVINDIAALVPSEFYHYEHDGSLSYGFEMISQPCSLNYHLSLKDTHEQVFRTVINNGLRSHDIAHCGLHIHIDKQFFGSKLDSSTAKLLYIFEKFSDPLLKFSRRNSYQVLDWCRFRKNEKTTPDWIKNTVKNSKGYYSHDDRYHAVNLVNSNTIEIRLWRGTLNINTFIATLKFTDRLARIAKDARAVDLARMSFSDLLGDDKDIIEYWNRIKDRNEDREDM